MTHENNETKGTVVEVKVDVTKIVKYVCITGICIVGIIFGTGCIAEFWKKLKEN